MNHRKWAVTIGLVTLTAVISAVTTLALQSTLAVAQTNADCRILWAIDDDYQGLANQTAALVAKGYVPAGLAAQDSYLYTLACRK